MQNVLSSAANLVSKTINEITELLSEPAYFAVLSRLKSNLKKEQSFLEAQAGTPSINTDIADGPATVTKMFGKTIGAPKRVYQQEVNDVDRNEVAGNVATQELKEKVLIVYPEFSKMSNDEILDSLSDLEIRGVAIRADLPVTETSPKKIDHKFIETIKDAIAKKAELDSIKKDADANMDNDGDGDGENENGPSLNDLNEELKLLEEKIHDGELNKIHHNTLKSLYNKREAIIEQIANFNPEAE